MEAAQRVIRVFPVAASKGQPQVEEPHSELEVLVLGRQLGLLLRAWAAAHPLPPGDLHRRDRPDQACQLLRRGSGAAAALQEDDQSDRRGQHRGEGGGRPPGARPEGPRLPGPLKRARRRRGLQLLLPAVVQDVGGAGEDLVAALAPGQVLAEASPFPGRELAVEEGGDVLQVRAGGGRSGGFSYGMASNLAGGSTSWDGPGRSFSVSDRPLAASGILAGPW